MPTLNLPKKEPKSTVHSDTPMRELRKKAYNTTRWRKLRLSFLKEHPLCAECLKEGKVTPAEHVHHLKSPFSKGQVNQALMYDETNLESICAYHHGLEHQKDNGYAPPGDILMALEELFKDIPD